jgi:hypothetical protein
MCTSSSNLSSYVCKYYAFIWKAVIRCFGLTTKLASNFMQKKDMVDILTWLFHAAPLLVSVKAPSNTSKQPEVSDSDYLLFSLLLKLHLFEEGQSSLGADLNEDPIAPLLAELVRLGTYELPSSQFVGTFFSLSMGN